MKRYLNLLCTLLFLFVMSNRTVVGEESLIVYTSGHTLQVTTAEGQDILRIGYRLWGPSWAWSGIDGTYRSAADSNMVAAALRAAEGEFAGRIGGSNVPFTFHTLLTAEGKRQLKMSGEFKTTRDSGLTMAGIGLAFDVPLRGKDRGIYTDASGTHTVNLPLGLGTLTDSFQKINVKDTDGKTGSVT